MISDASKPRMDQELLKVGSSILKANGFSLEYVSDGMDAVFAEDRNFVVIMVATSTIRDLIEAEHIALRMLGDRMHSVDLGPKVWDTYLVLLTQDRSSDDPNLMRQLFSINYDTSKVRRMAHVGVELAPESLRIVLAPFIEPTISESIIVDINPLLSLSDALISRGIAAEVAQRVVGAFEQGASLDDIF